MKLPCPTYGRGRDSRFAIALALAILLTASQAFGYGVKGLDTSSAANGSAPSQVLWNDAYSEGYEFAFVRSSRGGLVAGEPSTGQPLGEGKLDDSHFYSNITRATTAGMLAGSYHYVRADLSHPAINEATHYLNMAGAYMKPGFLLPVVDVESGSARTATDLTNHILGIVTAIEAQTGITPIIYSNASYANDEVTEALAFNGSTPRTYHWLARPNNGPITDNPPPASSIPNPYGQWDPNFVTRTNSRYPAVPPWAFWQQTLNVTPTGLFKIDIDYANGNIEFVKDFLVPALWTNAGSGDWATTANWNSDNPAYNGTIQSGPAPRLPNNSSLDWVKLQNPSDGTVTISSGARNVRKFYTEQPLNINAGSLNVSYVPGSGGKWDLPSEFNGVVTLGVGAGYSAHTTQVNGGGGQFNLNGGGITFADIQLASHATSPGKIIVGGDINVFQTGGAGTSVIQSTGNLAQPGSIELTAGDRSFTVNNGSAAVDLDVRVSITGAGRLEKRNPGVMQLSRANSHTGGTGISSGVLQISADDRLGQVPASLDPTNIRLNGGTLRTGAQIDSVSLTNAGSGYTSFPTLTIGGAGASVHTASANVLSGIASIAVTNGGSGYINQNPSSPPAFNTPGTFVDIVGGGGTGATAYATVVGGTVTAITISNPGTGYTSMPNIFISSTVSGGFGGSGATASVNGITLQGIALNHGGFDYTNPTITLTGGGGTGATAAATSDPIQTLDANRGITLTNSGGTLHQTAGTVLTVDGPISSTGAGNLNKSGPGRLVLANTNTYTGGTFVNDGVLQLSGSAASLGTGFAVVFEGTTSNTSLVIDSGVTNAIDDDATLNLFGGGTPDIADQGYASLGDGITEVVGFLMLDGIAQPNGTYGSSLSSATFKLDEYFSGTGILQVGAIPPIFAGDFNDDGIVDAGDYIVWKKNVGQPAGTLPNDDTGVAIGVDQYNLWRTNFGNTEAGSGGAVPEPATIALILFVFAPLSSLRRQRS